MWRTFIELHANIAAASDEPPAITDGTTAATEESKGRTYYKLPPEFPLSTLAHISEGYSAGSIKKTCEIVFTDFRKSKLEVRPLALAEFLGPLTSQSCTDAETNEEFKKFTDIITGDKKRRDEIQAALNPDAEADKGKKGKPAKKKGK
jgi:hypothetical protein